MNKHWGKNSLSIFSCFPSYKCVTMFNICIYTACLHVTKILSVPKFTANLYFICLSIPQIYTYLYSRCSIDLRLILGHSVIQYNCVIFAWYTLHAFMLFISLGTSEIDADNCLKSKAVINLFLFIFRKYLFSFTRSQNDWITNWYK